MFTYFAPNWALFLFSLFQMIGGCYLHQIKGDELEIQCLGAFAIGGCNLHQTKAYDLGIQFAHILRPIGRFFYFRYFK